MLRIRGLLLSLLWQANSEAFCGNYALCISAISFGWQKISKVRFCYLWCHMFKRALYILIRSQLQRFCHDTVSASALHAAKLCAELFSKNNPVAAHLLLSSGLCRTKRRTLTIYVPLPLHTPANTDVLLGIKLAQARKAISLILKWNHQNSLWLGAFRY